MSVVTKVFSFVHPIIDDFSFAMDSSADELKVGQRLRLTTELSMAYIMSAEEFRFRDRINVSYCNEPRPYNIIFDAEPTFPVYHKFSECTRVLTKHLPIVKRWTYTIDPVYEPSEMFPSLGEKVFKRVGSSYRVTSTRYTNKDDVAMYELYPYEELKSDDDTPVYLVITISETNAIERVK